MKSKIYSSKYKKSTTKGQMWVPASLSLAFFMAFPMLELMQFSNWSASESMTMAQKAASYENLWISEFLFLGFAAIIFGALINGLSSFWYLYSSRKTDFYHSLPVRRSAMFRSRAVTGVVYCMVPYVVMEFLAVCIGALRGFFSLKIVKMAVIMFFLHLILYLLIYFGTALVICVTGNLLMGILCLGGLFFYGGTLGLLLGFYRQLFYKNAYYYREESWGLLAFLDEYASPVFLGKTLLEYYSGGNYAGLLAAVILVTVVMAILAWTAYTRRPSESAGKSMVYRWIAVVIKFLVVVPCGLGIGLFFYLCTYDNNGGTGWWIFGMILGTILSHGLLETIYLMDFRGFFAKKLQLVLAGVLVAVCALNYHMDLLHFDTYLPVQEKLEAVNVGFNVNGLDYTLLTQEDDGMYRTLGSWDCEEAIQTGADGVGDRTWDALQEIVSAGNQEKEDTEELYTIYVKYTLKSGHEVYRSYNITETQLADLLEALYAEGTLKEKMYSILQIDSQYLEEIYGTFMDGNSEELYAGQQEEMEEFLDALKADMEEASAEDLMKQPCAILYAQYSVPGDETHFSSIQRLGKEISYVNNFGGSLYVYPSFERTLALLREADIPVTMEEVSLKSVKISYYTKEVFDEYYDTDPSITVTYRNKEELEALKQALIPSSLYSEWNKSEAYVDVSFTTGDDSEPSAVLLCGSTPDFVKEKIEEVTGSQ